MQKSEGNDIFDEFIKKIEEGNYRTLTTGKVAQELNLNVGQARKLLSHLVENKTIASLADRNNEVVYLILKKSNWQYQSKELFNILSPCYFDTVGKFLMEAFSTKDIELTNEFLEERDNDLGMPLEILDQIITCFADAGLVKKDRSGLTKEGAKAELGHNILKLTFMSKRLLNIDFTDINISFPVSKIELKSITQLQKIYSSHKKKKGVTALNIIIPKNKITIQHITEVLIGHQDADIEFLKKLTEYLKDLNPEKKPDVLVISGLIQGNFPYRQKNRRTTLVEDLKNLNNQFKAAKLILKNLADLGIKVIYNLSSDDREICEAYTVTALRIIDSLPKHLKDTKKKYISYYQLDKLKQGQDWDFHSWFQQNVVFEYMLRSGRRLYSATESENLFGEKIEEYLILLDAWLALEKNEEVPQEFYKKILKIENIPSSSNKEFRGSDFIVTDNFNLTVKLNSGKEIDFYERHNFTLTQTSMTQDPTKAAREIIGHIQSMGLPAPHVFVIEHQQQSVGVLKDETLILSTPGMQTANLNWPGYSSEVSIDPSKRKLTTRREIFQAGSMAVCKTADGRCLIKFYNRKFLEKAQLQLPKERTTIALFSDWQIGSVTARPDLQIKALDFVLFNVLPQRPLVIAFAGDIIQGRNYPHMPNENVRMGLIKIEDQQAFFRKMLLDNLVSVPKNYLKNIKGVEIVPGNHEYNSFYHLTGTTYSRFIADIFNDFFATKGLTPVATYYDKLTTKFGEHFNAWVAKKNVAGYEILIKHVILGGKSKGGTQMPIYQGKELLKGTGKLMENVDIILSGHYHEPKFQMINDKLVIINGSLAGISGFELDHAYYPTMATTLLHVGGGEVPELEILTAETLFSHKPRGGFSDKYLKKKGFITDKSFNPAQHGFVRTIEQPQSAIQKYLWRLVDEILWNVHKF